jgi:hypothetical protein
MAWRTARLTNSCLYGLDRWSRVGFKQGTATRRESGDFATLARVRKAAAHGTNAGWHSGCHCASCRLAHSNDQRTRGRARAQKRLLVEVRKQLLDAIYDRKPFRQVLRDFELTPNRVWGLTKSD